MGKLVYAVADSRQCAAFTTHQFMLDVYLLFAWFAPAFAILVRLASGVTPKMLRARRSIQSFKAKSIAPSSQGFSAVG